MRDPAGKQEYLNREGNAIYNPPAAWKTRQENWSVTNGYKKITNIYSNALLFRGLCSNGIYTTYFYNVINFQACGEIIFY